MADPSITRSTRTFILAALLATLAATALVAMSFVILGPARVSFKVTNAWRTNSSNDGTVCLHLSIVASSSQRRTGVKLESVFIDLLNSSDYLGRQDDWRRRISAHADEVVPGGYVEYPGITRISASAAAPNRTFPEFAPDWLVDDVGLTVTVMAQVRFKVGAVRTRLYGITVYCDSVVFPDQKDASSHPRKRMAAKTPVARDGSKFAVTCHS